MKYKTFLLLLIYISLLLPLSGQQLWDESTYPDEISLQKRLAPMLERIAQQDFGIRSLASSKCPDTGLPVKVWAVEGETIISPYTGRAYLQGPTGYFGPRSRNDQGQITAFGGDPLKYDLPPATAALLLNPQNQRAKQFLSIPGNLRQQYHFACKNWARFYPLLANEMGEAWKQSFYNAVATYEEARRPSDGAREWNPMSHPHNLVGQEGHLLGGNSLDGGTENHKTMWRTSSLVYAQLFPEDALISGHSVKEAKRLTLEMIRDYLKRLLYTGNGEYDSQIYYPHSIQPFLNLYDFSKDAEIKHLAKFALDYYFLTYGLKVVDGAIAGAQKRGYLPHARAGEMETMLWAYFNDTSRDMSAAVTTIHQRTTTYRPNKIIYNILRQKMTKPYEARMSRPFYHMDHFNAFQESYYRSESFGLGNVNMSIVDNPNQQMVWSMVAEGKDGPLAISGGQPFPQGSTGHSPYTQTAHSKGTLLLMTAPTQINKETEQDFQISTSRMNPWHLPDTAQASQYERANRQRYAETVLQEVKNPEANATSVLKFWKEKKYTAASWLWLPRAVDEQVWVGNRLLLRFHETMLAILPLTDEYFFIELPEQELEKVAQKALKQALSEYQLLVVAGDVSGYIIETVEASAYTSLTAFAETLAEKTRLDDSRMAVGLQLDYHSVYGDRIEMQYQPEGLKAAVRINGQELDYGNWTSAAVYDSPYLKIKEGILEVTDGQEGYRVDFRGKNPVYELWE